MVRVGRIAENIVNIGQHSSWIQKNQVTGLHNNIVQQINTLSPSSCSIQEQIVSLSLISTIPFYLLKHNKGV